MVMLIRRLKVFLLAVASFFLLACPTAAVFADDACSIAGFNDPLICGTPHEDEEAELKTRVRNVLNVVYLWIGIIAVIVMVIGGIRYMTSSDDAAKSAAICLQNTAFISNIIASSFTTSLTACGIIEAVSPAI